MSKKVPYFSQVNMTKEGRPEHWWNRGLQLSAERIREAMANTRSNKEAARWLGITDITYKKYAKAHIDEATGKSLFELHKNQAGKGMPKKWAGSAMKKDLDEMLTDAQPINSKRISKLKEALMKDGRLGYQCSCCQFSEKRLTDMKAPLLLNFVNGKRSDWRIENLRWLCYNCYFLLIEDPFSNKMIQRIEAIPLDAPEIKEEAQEMFQIDQFYYEHLKNLGLDGEGDVRFKDIDTHTGTDDLDDLVDYKK